MIKMPLAAWYIDVEQSISVVNGLQELMADSLGEIKSASE